MPFTTIAFQTAMRAASVSLLGAYASAASLELQVYPGRPRSIYPPTGFVDRMSEETIYTGPTLRQRRVACEVVIIHGLFDSAEAVDQKDAFADGFADYVTDNRHEAGGDTLIESIRFADDPNYVPDWLPPAEQRQYYATRITLEGFAGG